MNTLLLLRESFKRLYADYDYIIRPVSKFLLSFVTLILLQGRIGYMEAISSISVILICSILAMFLPYGFISFLCAVFLLGDMFSVSYAMAGFGLCLLMTIFVLYYGFRPGTGIFMTIVPLMFFLKIPFVIPLFLGLSMGLSSIVPTLLGVVTYYLVAFFSTNAATFSDISGIEESLDSFLDITRTVLMNRYMYVMMAGFAFSIIVVYLISHSSMNHAWTRAIIGGAAVLLVIVLLADLRFGGNLLAHIIGLLVSLGIAFFYEVVFFNLDYKHTEYLRFEDDDYFYFVKAVPKVKPEDEDLRRE